MTLSPLSHATSFMVAVFCRKSKRAWQVRRRSRTAPQTAHSDTSQKCNAKTLLGEGHDKIPRASEGEALHLINIHKIFCLLHTIHFFPQNCATPMSHTQTFPIVFRHTFLWFTKTRLLSTANWSLSSTSLGKTTWQHSCFRWAMTM